MLQFNRAGAAPELRGSKTSLRKERFKVLSTRVILRLSLHFSWLFVSLAWRPANAAAGAFRGVFSLI